MKPSESQYDGMTANERLHAAGLLGQFDAAVKTQNRDAMLKMLKDVNISANDAVIIADKILAAPKQYGY